MTDRVPRGDRRAGRRSLRARFAGRLATDKERAALLRAAASSEKGKRLRLRVGRSGRVTFAPLTLTIRAHVLAVRSLVDPSWALLVVAREPGSDVRETFVLERARGRWRVRLAAYRGSEYDGAVPAPTPRRGGGHRPGADGDRRGSSCRHERSRKSLVRPMSAEELASVRAMVEWSEDVDENGARIRGPVQPEVSEVSTGSCEWDADPETGTPYGEVARADPRWGRVVVMCVTGSDGFAALVNQTLLLVGRAGTSGPFTRVAAHTNMSWSSWATSAPPAPGGRYRRRRGSRSSSAPRSRTRCGAPCAELVAARTAGM